MISVQAATKTVALIVLSAALLGCGKAPESIVEQVAHSTPQQTIVDQPAGKSLPGFDGRVDQSSTPEPLTNETPQPEIRFSKPETRAAVEAYGEAWDVIQEDAEQAKGLSNIDPIQNPAAITDYLNRIGGHANALDQAERTARRLMTPDERKRFRAYQQTLRDALQDSE